MLRGHTSPELIFVKRTPIHKVIKVETVDHPSDSQLVAYARKYFEDRDRMR